MTTLSTDSFIEAFAAMLVQRGERSLKLNDPRTRDQLFRVYEFFENEIVKGERTDRAWRRSLINIRNVFEPSSIGSFDEFESLMREKQAYLTEHPNPYYGDIIIKLPPTAASSIVSMLPCDVRELAYKAVDTYSRK